GDRKQRLAPRDRLVQHAVELLAAVRALGDAEPLALIVDEGLGGRFQDLGRQHGRPCAEGEYAVAHSALLPPGAPEFQRLRQTRFLTCLAAFFAARPRRTGAAAGDDLATESRTRNINRWHARPDPRWS